MAKGLDVFLLLLGVVAGLALLARKLRVPYTLLLVVAGLGLGWIPGLAGVRFPPQLFLRYLLPVLVYPAALFMPWRDFRDNLRPIALLASGLVVCTPVRRRSDGARGDSVAMGGGVHLGGNHRLQQTRWHGLGICRSVSAAAAGPQTRQ